MAQFFKVFNMQGFDRHRATRWQMVPWFGTRYVALREGAGLSVTSSNPAVVSVIEVKPTDLPAGDREPLQATDRLFMLFGVWPASAVIRAAGGTGAVNLEVDVKSRKTVRITFNFVKDNAGHKTKRVPAQAAQWVRTMNYVYNGQANIDIISKDAREVTVAKNLGNTITTTQNGVGEEGDIYPKGDPDADINMFLVWNMDITDSGGDEDAFADGKRIVFEDNAGSQVGETMAHEVGHVLGLDDHYDGPRRRELMYGITDTRGVHLPKEHVNAINP